MKAKRRPIRSVIDGRLPAGADAAPEALDDLRRDRDRLRRASRGCRSTPSTRPRRPTSGSSTSASSTSRSASSSASRSSSAGSSTTASSRPSPRACRTTCAPRAWRPLVHSIRFSGADGFFVLYNLPPAGRGRVPPNLEEEAARLRASVARRLRQTLDGTTADFINILASSLTAADNPRVRPARHVIRTLQEAVKIVTQRQTHEKLELFAGLKTVIGQKQLRPAFQPVRHLPDGAIMGYEALIRGPQGTSLEPPTVLFAVAHENEMDVELETLCLETIFANLPARRRRASPLRQRLGDAAAPSRSSWTSATSPRSTAATATSSSRSPRRRWSATTTRSRTSSTSCARRT